MPSASKIISQLNLNDLYLKYNIDERPIGSGSYGYVYAAYDKETSEKVAIKILYKFPDDTIDRKRLFREIKVLRMLKGHANTIHLKHITTSTTQGSLFRVALIFEHHETNLSRIIKSKQPLTIDHIGYFLYQILTGVHYTHSANLVHRDLKPANILVNSDCRTTICDFGLARATQRVVMEKAKHSETSFPPLYQRLTHYVVTRWYRSPELVLRNSNAGEAPADMWSVGCILAELLLREPLFKKAHDAHTLIRLILGILGTPKLEDCEWIENTSYRNKIKERRITPSQIYHIFKDSDADAVDLLKGLLHFNPSKRLTAEQALQHPFLRPYADEKAPSKFSIASMTEVEREALDAYYLFERESENCRQSETVNRRIHALIQSEVAEYATTPPSTLSTSSTSTVPTVCSPSAVPGTIFHHKEPDSDTSIIDSQHTKQAEKPSTQPAPECLLI